MDLTFAFEPGGSPERDSLIRQRHEWLTRILVAYEYLKLDVREAAVVRIGSEEAHLIL